MPAMIRYLDHWATAALRPCQQSCAKTSNYKQGTIEIGIAEEWLNIAPDTTRHPVESMPRRLEAVISAKGYATKY
ncbi:hypothetical protein TNCV_1070871 [Trichonephila clavipes]|nr:hypothetical protein TNCV_1070871 [Trichonephila clavipes]